MNVVLAHSQVNPNTQVANPQGIWLAYILLARLLHVALLSLPFFSNSVVLTLTHIATTVCVCLLTYDGGGAPLESLDQDLALLLTH